MPELLFEIFSEEIPARFQRRAAEDLKKAVTDALVDNGLTYESAAGFATPRRLTVTVTDIPPSSPDTKEERKGPRVGAPEKAIEGFLRGAGLANIDEAVIMTDPKKGEHYVAVIEKTGSSATHILAEILPKIIQNFSWAKPMRWGAGRLQWVRPIRAITATFGTENEEPEVVSFEVEGTKSGQETFGHRFMAPEPIRVKRFSDYVQNLEKAKVVLDLDRRMQIIKTDAENLAFAQGLDVIDNKGLLEEVAGLVEWPVVMMGTFSEAYLELPEEVIITTIRANQKCFCLRDSQSGKLANKFLLTSNMQASDGGKTIVAGNERVILARLSDAMFFYKNDLATPLIDRLPKLKDMVFHKKLGSQAERVERLVSLAEKIAPLVGADVKETKRAAQLAKADLVTEMVVEFTNLQGLMGRYYAIAQGEKPEVANAIETHYKPVGAADDVPTEPVAIAVALADKLDVLAGFWAIDEKPTGSRDPFALRRAALGVIRILVENEISFPLDEFISNARWLHKHKVPFVVDDVERSSPGDSIELAVDVVYLTSLFDFFLERMKVLLRNDGAHHDLVDAVLSVDNYDILSIRHKVSALSGLITTEAGQSLLAGYRRGANILAAEEKKDSVTYRGGIEPELLKEVAEISLATAIETAHKATATLVMANDYAGAISALAVLHAPVDAFFEAVLVNDEDPAIRKNRLNLLAQLRDTMHLVADFSKISG